MCTSYNAKQTSLVDSPGLCCGLNVACGFKYVLFLFWLFVGNANADESSGTWLLILDNDTFTHTDGHYTNGFQLGWISGSLAQFNEGPIPEFMSSGMNALPLINAPDRHKFISLSASHRLFTPTNTETSEPVTDDMPYSAILVGSITAGAEDEQTLDAYTFNIGLTGPLAQGEWVQNQFHRMIGAQKVNGWDNQIHNEPLLNMGYEHRHQLVEFGDRKGLGGDLLAQLGGKLGNLISMATVGVGARFGWGVPDDFGTPPQLFGDETVGSRPYAGYQTDHGIWLSIFANATAVGNAIFWNGNTFKDSLSIDFEPVIARVFAGINARAGHWEASIAYIRNTETINKPTNKTQQSYARMGLWYSY